MLGDSRSALLDDKVLRSISVKHPVTNDSQNLPQARGPNKVVKPSQPLCKSGA